MVQTDYVRKHDFAGTLDVLQTSKAAPLLVETILYCNALLK